MSMQAIVLGKTIGVSIKKIAAGIPMAGFLQW